jgi:hypothetical protein
VERAARKFQADGCLKKDWVCDLKRAMCVQAQGHGGKLHHKNLTKVFYDVSEWRWEVSVNYLGKSCAPCLCWDGAQSKSPTWWCVPSKWIWWRRFWCFGASTAELLWMF